MMLNIVLLKDMPFMKNVTPTIYPSNSMRLTDPHIELCTDKNALIYFN
jgi:hypothetical protein